MFFRRKPPSLRSVLFVCTANVTRSPAAAALFADLAAKSGEKWEIASAGIKAGKGFPPNHLITLRMRQRNLSITSHRSQPLTQKLLRRYRWILVMENAQREAILKMDPSASDKVFTLRTFGRDDSDHPTDFPDPTGREHGDYYELFDLLDIEIPRVFKYLRNRLDDMNLVPE